MTSGSDSHNLSDNSEIAPSPGTHNALIYLVVGIAALGGLLVGYNSAVIAGAILFIAKDFHLNPTQVEIAVSAVLMGAIIGALCAGPMNDALGRKRALMLMAVIFSVGSLVTAVAPTYGFFLACRILVGFCIGAAASVVPVYISEVAPANLRGRLVTFNQIAITFGIALSYWVDLAFAIAGKGWRPMFAVAVIPSAVLFLGMFLTPETPFWLASHGRWDVPLHCCFRAQLWSHLLADERRNIPDAGAGSGIKHLNVRQLGRQFAGERYLSLAGQWDRTVGYFLALCGYGCVGFRLLSENGTRNKGQEPGRDRVLLGTTGSWDAFTNEWS